MTTGITRHNFRNCSYIKINNLTPYSRGPPSLDPMTISHIM
jgi:hypothetical protein